MTASVTACACPAAAIGEMYEKTRADGFGAEVRRRVMIGTYVLSAGYYDAYYLRAQKGPHPYQEGFRGFASPRACMRS